MTDDLIDGFLRELELGRRDKIKRLGHNPFDVVGGAEKMPDLVRQYQRIMELERRMQNDAYSGWLPTQQRPPQNPRHHAPLAGYVNGEGVYEMTLLTRKCEQVRLGGYTPKSYLIELKVAEYLNGKPYSGVPLNYVKRECRLPIQLTKIDAWLRKHGYGVRYTRTAETRF